MPLKCAASCVLIGSLSATSPANLYVHRATVAGSKWSGQFLPVYLRLIGDLLLPALVALWFVNVQLLEWDVENVVVFVVNLLGGE